MEEFTEVTEVTNVLAVEGAVAPKKKRTPAKKKTEVREFATLCNTEVHRMSPEEVKLYVKELRARDSYLSMREEELTKNCESAYTQLRATTAELENLRRAYTTKMNFILQSIGALNTSVNLVVKGDV